MFMRTLYSLVLAIPLLAACGADTAREMPLPTVSTMAPSVRDVEVERDFVGEIRAVNEAEIRSKVTGRILDVQFREGQLVSAGQPLFKIDSDSLQEGVREAEASVNNAKAALNKARTDVARFQPLVEKGTISRQQFDTAVAAERQAKAVVDGTQAALASAQIMQRESALVSPYNGRIGRAQIKVGALATAGQTLLATVSTTEAMRVDFALSESDYLELVRPFLEKNAPGTQRAPITTKLILNDGSRYGYDGTITFSDRVLSADTGTFAISATYPNPNEVLRPGMFGRVRIVVSRLSQAILVPQKALQPVLDKVFVSVLGADNVVERRPVTVGARVGAEVVIVAGLAATDVVIVDGHHKARQGSKVQPVPVAASAAEINPPAAPIDSATSTAIDSDKKSAG